METAETHSNKCHCVHRKECVNYTIPKASRAGSGIDDSQGVMYNNGIESELSTTLEPCFQLTNSRQLKILEYLKMIVENQKEFESQMTKKVQNLEAKNAELENIIQEVCMKLDSLTSTKLENRIEGLNELELEGQQDREREAEEARRSQEAKQAKEAKQAEEARQAKEARKDEEQQQTEEAEQARMSQTDCVVPELAEGDVSKEEDVNSWLVMNIQFMTEQAGAEQQAEQLHSQHGHQKSAATAENPSSYNECDCDIRQPLERHEQNCNMPHEDIGACSLSNFLLEDTDSTCSISDFEQLSDQGLFVLAGVDPAHVFPNQEQTIQTEKEEAKREKKLEEEGIGEVRKTEDVSSSPRLNKVEKLETEESEMLQAQARKLKALQAKAKEAKELLTEISEGQESLVHISQGLKSSVQTQPQENQLQVLQNQEIGIQALQTLDRQSQRFQNSEIKMHTLQSPERETSSLKNLESQAHNLQNPSNQVLQDPGNQTQSSLKPTHTAQATQTLESQVQLPQNPESQTEVSRNPESQARILQKPVHTTQAAQTLGSQAQISQNPEGQTQVSQIPESQTQVTEKLDSQSQVPQNLENRVQKSQALESQPQVSEVLENKNQSSQTLESQAQSSKNPENQVQVLFVPENTGKRLQTSQGQAHDSQTPRIQSQTSQSQASQAQILQTSPSQMQNSQTPKPQTQSTQPPAREARLHQVVCHPPYQMQQHPHQPPQQPLHQPQQQFQQQSQQQLPYMQWQTLHQAQHQPQHQPPVIQAQVVYPQQSQVPVLQFTASQAQGYQAPANQSQFYHPGKVYRRPQPQMIPPTENPSQTRPSQPPQPQGGCRPATGTAMVPPVGGGLTRDGPGANSTLCQLTGQTAPQNPIAQETKRQCPFCNLNFQVVSSSAQQLFERHVETHMHFVCPICSLSFGQQEYEKFMNHTASHNLK